MNVLCADCGITEADLYQPSIKWCSRHGLSKTAPCKWAYLGKRLYDFVRRGGDMETVECLFCLIPPGDVRGVRWAKLHRRWGEPICAAADNAEKRPNRKRRGTTRQQNRNRYPRAIGPGEETYMDKDGNLYDFDCLTREQYMAARR